MTFGARSGRQISIKIELIISQLKNRKNENIKININ